MSLDLGKKGFPDDLSHTLSDELHQLATETFEVEDLTEVTQDMASWSSSCSTSSCCSCSTSSCCSCSTSCTTSTSSCN